MKFIYPGDSHAHSLQTLNQLYEYDDFMGSIKSLIDLGCGTGDDLVWWATRTTRDDNPVPLHIRCTGLDILPAARPLSKYPNTQYQQQDFEGNIIPHPGGFDVLWCHDAFQYALNPIQTLSNWWHITSDGGMLALCVPVTQKVYQKKLSYHLHSGCFYHHTMVSLIYMLATAGWDCRAGFFLQRPTDPWIHAIVYKSSLAPISPKTSSWIGLSEAKLLPESADRSVQAHGYLRQQDLIVPWVDKSISSMALL